MRRRRMAEVNKPPRFSARKAACLLTNLSKEACLYAGADWLKLFGHCVSQRVARGQFHLCAVEGYFHCSSFLCVLNFSPLVSLMLHMFCSVRLPFFMVFLCIVWSCVFMSFRWVLSCVLTVFLWVWSVYNFHCTVRSLSIRVSYAFCGVVSFEFPMQCVELFL